MSPTIHSRPSNAPQERSTKQKRALAAVLDAGDSFRSAQELFAELRQRGENVGLTTVYNQLRALADGGEVDVLRSDDGEALYRRCATGDHHHHLVCRRCSQTLEVEGPEVERWAERVAAEHQFVDVSHTFEIFGTCAVCSADGGPADEAAAERVEEAAAEQPPSGGEPPSEQAPPGSGP